MPCLADCGGHRLHELFGSGAPSDPSNPGLGEVPGGEEQGLRGPGDSDGARAPSSPGFPPPHPHCRRRWGNAPSPWLSLSTSEGQAVTQGLAGLRQQAGGLPGPVGDGPGASAGLPAWGGALWGVGAGHQVPGGRCALPRWCPCPLGLPPWPSLPSVPTCLPRFPQQHGSFTFSPPCFCCALRTSNQYLGVRLHECSLGRAASLDRIHLTLGICTLQPGKLRPGGRAAGELGMSQDSPRWGPGFTLPPNREQLGQGEVSQSSRTFVLKLNKLPGLTFPSGEWGAGRGGDADHSERASSEPERTGNPTGNRRIKRVTLSQSLKAGEGRHRRRAGGR